MREITAAVRRFAEEREWQPFHTPRIWRWPGRRAGELLALFQWLTAEESRGLSPARLAEVADEIADVQMYLAALADQLDIDIAGAVSARWPRTR